VVTTIEVDPRVNSTTWAMTHTDEWRLIDKRCRRVTGSTYPHLNVDSVLDADEVARDMPTRRRRHEIISTGFFIGKNYTDVGRASEPRKALLWELAQSSGTSMTEADMRG
jgi:hypothetical protein